MTDDQIALARRAVSCKAWRWMPGMADQFGRRVMQVYPNELGFKWSHLLENNVVRDADALPDLTDAATLGCVLALVREAWGDPGMFVRPRGSKMRPDWAVFTGQNSDLVCSASREVEALVVAWEAAPNTGGEHRREESKP